MDRSTTRSPGRAIVRTAEIRALQKRLGPMLLPIAHKLYRGGVGKIVLRAVGNALDERGAAIA